MSTENNKPKSIGAMWKKQNDKGKYLSGQIEIDGKKIDFVAYPNSYKTEDKHPDLRMFLKTGRAGTTATKAPVSTKRAVPVVDEDNDASTELA